MQLNNFGADEDQLIANADLDTLELLEMHGFTISEPDQEGYVTLEMLDLEAEAIDIEVDGEMATYADLHIADLELLIDPSHLPETEEELESTPIEDYLKEAKLSVAEVSEKVPYEPVNTKQGPIFLPEPAKENIDWVEIEFHPEDDDQMSYLLGHVEI